MTKKQRNEAYRWAYERIAADSGKCICETLEICGKGKLRHFILYPEMLEQDFPEMHLFNPERRAYWFEFNYKGQSERLTCLAFCIAMTN